MKKNKRVEIPDYDAKDLRPNPEMARKDMGPLRDVNDTIQVGDFGSWGASGRVTNGLPKKRSPK